MRGRRSCLWLLAWGAALAGCSLQRNVFQSGQPFVPTSFTVESRSQRGAWLDAWLAGDDLRLRFFAPDTPACRSVLSPGRELRWSDWRIAGLLEAGDERCEPVGIGSLAEWARRQPRRSASQETLAPRAQASFREIHRDDEAVLLRGRFPLVGAVGWTGGLDTIAVLPVSADCESAIEDGVASMESRSGGDTPLVLLGSEGPCPIEGLIRPTGPAGS